MEIKQEQENEKVMLQGELSPGDQRPRCQSGQSGQSVQLA